MQINRKYRIALEEQWRTKSLFKKLKKAFKGLYGNFTMFDHKLYGLRDYGKDFSILSKYGELFASRILESDCVLAFINYHYFVVDNEIKILLFAHIVYGGGGCRGGNISLSK